MHLHSLFSKAGRFYRHLPLGARSAAGSIYGFYLQSCRYGSDLENLVAEAHDRERWSASQWQAYREDRLARLLHRAATRVPYYRALWAERRRTGYRGSWELLENWPVLEKEVVRANSRAFLADDCDPRRMLAENTSGTTGKPVDYWFGRQAIRQWHALFEARWRRWNGVTVRSRWAYLGGRIIIPVERQNPPFWIWNAASKQLYLSGYHLKPRLVPYYLDAIERHRIEYIWGYASAVHYLAQEALRLGRTLKLKLAATNAEPLYAHQRTVIARAFRCSVRETYGLVEMLTAASECVYDHLHLWPETGILEALEGDVPVSPGTPGDLVGTGFINPDMPLIRYRYGDRGILGHSFECPCGRLLPRLESIEGRISDAILTIDGRQLAPAAVEIVFDTTLPVRESQIIQEKLTQFRIRYVPAPGFNEQAAQTIIERLRTRVGHVDVILDPVSEIQRTGNGKLRSVLCELSNEERRAARVVCS
jgi:phenylacetate-CoA ligase